VARSCAARLSIADDTLEREAAVRQREPGTMAAITRS